MILERGEVEVWNNPRARKSTESVNYQMTFKPLSSLVAVCFFAALSAHAGSYVYPKNGQSAEQQQLKMSMSVINGPPGRRVTTP